MGRGMQGNCTKPFSPVRPSRGEGIYNLRLRVVFPRCARPADCKSATRQVADLRYERGAKPDRSSLTDAIEVGDKSIVELLLANGADPHGRTGIGLNLTMYQFALAEHRKEIAELLK